MKRCSRCRAEKEFSEFFIDRSRRDGLTHACKKCRAECAAKWLQENREAVLAKMARYRREHPEIMKASHLRWKERHPERAAQNNIQWREKNRVHHNAYKAARRAEKTRATPAWACSETIRDFYAEAEYFGMEVDHIVPLRSPLVCGLHCEANLQLLSARDNLKKGNRRWPDMP